MFAWYHKLMVLYIQALIALLPTLMKLLDLFIKTPADKQKEFVEQLPARLAELHGAFLDQSKNHDPSGVNKQLNGG